MSALRRGYFRTPEQIQQPPSRARTSGASAVLQDSITKRLSNKATGVAADGGSEAEVEAKADRGVSDAESGRNAKKRRKQPVNLEEGGDASPDNKAASARRTSNEAAEREQVEEDKPAAKPTWPKPTAAGQKGPRPRWQLIAAAAAVVLVIGGASGFLIFGGKKATPKPVAKASPAKAKPAPTPPPKAKVEPPPPPPPRPFPKTPPKVEFALSAPRLSDELTANAAEANAVYAGKILEVSGLFAQVEKKDGLRRRDVLTPSSPRKARRSAATCKEVAPTSRPGTPCCRISRSPCGACMKKTASCAIAS